MFNKVVSKAEKLLYFLIILVVSTVVLSGCKEKPPAPAPKAIGPVGTCEIFDKLPSDIAKPVEITYDNRAKLLGITSKRISQNQLKISYYWQVLAELTPYYRAFVIFSDKDDKQLSGHDHDICQNRPFSELKGKFIKETYTVDMPQTAIGKKINIGVGIFAPDLNPASSRLKITSAGKTPLTDNNTRAIVEEIDL